MAAVGAGHGKRGRKAEEDDDKVDSSEVRWLISYSDYMMQLVVLFILLFSISSMSEEKMKAIAEEARKYLHLRPKGHYPPMDDRMPDPKSELPVIRSQIEQLRKDLEDHYGVEPRVGAIDTTKINEGIKISVRDAVFEESSAVVPEPMKPILDDVAKGLQSLPSTRVELRGHTSVSARDAENGDAYLLSYRRALEVRNYLLVDPKTKDPRLAPSRLRIVACGPNEAAAGSNSDSPEGSRVDRRVEIVVTEEHVEKK